MMKNAKLRMNACIEEIDYRTTRGLDKSMIRALTKESSSDRSGVMEIWECDADGSHQRRLSAFGKGHNSSPQFSPDSRQIAFDSSARGNQFDIYVIDANGSLPKRLTQRPASNEGRAGQAIANGTI